MNSHIFAEDHIDSYHIVHLTIKEFIYIIEKIIEQNPVAAGYMVRHSKFKGVSYNSDDEYADQFITLYIPPKKKNDAKKEAEPSSLTNENNVHNECDEL